MRSRHDVGERPLTQSDAQSLRKQLTNKYLCLSFGEAYPEVPVRAGHQLRWMFARRVGVLAP